MNAHTGHRLFSIRTIAVAITIAVSGAMVPQTADAQRTSLNSLDQKLDEVLCSLPSAPASCFTTRVVFVTSTIHTGDFGGVVGGDAICNGLAQAAHLPGVYRAWLSDRAGDPDTRFTHSDVPYVRTDDVTIANDWADLVVGLLLAPIDRDENAKPISFAPSVWTATRLSGMANLTLFSCNDWRSTSSLILGGGGTLANTIPGEWTAGVTSSCDLPKHFYCFQQ